MSHSFCAVHMLHHVSCSLHTLPHMLHAVHMPRHVCSGYSPHARPGGTPALFEHVGAVRAVTSPEAMCQSHLPSRVLAFTQLSVLPYLPPRSPLTSGSLRSRHGHV